MNINKNNLILGHGVSLDGKYQRSNLPDKLAREYSVWYNVLIRCYDKKYKNGKPTYENCTMSDNFKNFQYFAEWCNNQNGFSLGWHLDKDLLIRGNKFYSEDTCVFLPSHVNSFLTSRKRLRGEFPLGVTWDTEHSKFRARCSDGRGKCTHLGRFHNSDVAFAAYKQYKESVAKQLANEYVDLLDERAYKALMNYEVRIDD